MKIHTGDKPYKCVVCKKAFSRSTLLYRHQKIHRDVPRFECEECDRFFLVYEELEKHTQIHKKTRPFPCVYCTKSFAFKQGLERHEVIHSVSQPFSCSYCAASFNTQSKLQKHLTDHAGNRPYPCKYCPKSYLLSHHLTRHLRGHGKEGGVSVVFTCYRCGEELTTAERLVDHMMATHQNVEDNSCPLCNEHFETAEENRVHIQLHTEGNQFACEFCDLIFVDEDKLYLHSHEVHADEHRLYDEDMAKNMKKTSSGAGQKRKLPKVEILSTSAEEEEEVEEQQQVTEEPVKPTKMTDDKIKKILSKLPKSIEVTKSKKNEGISHVEIKTEDGSIRRQRPETQLPTKTYSRQRTTTAAKEGNNSRVK